MLPGLKRFSLAVITVLADRHLSRRCRRRREETQTAEADV